MNFRIILLHFVPILDRGRSKTTRTNELKWNGWSLLSPPEISEYMLDFPSPKLVGTCFDSSIQSNIYSDLLLQYYNIQFLFRIRTATKQTVFFFYSGIKAATKWFSKTISSAFAYANASITWLFYTQYVFIFALRMWKRLVISMCVHSYGYTRKQSATSDMFLFYRWWNSVGNISNIVWNHCANCYYSSLFIPPIQFSRLVLHLPPMSSSSWSVCENLQIA